MADLRRSETDTSRKSSRSQQSQSSRPTTPVPQLVSSNSPGDNAAYLDHHDDEDVAHTDDEKKSVQSVDSKGRRAKLTEDDSESTSDVGDLEKQELQQSHGTQETTVEEIRGGIPNERDIEAAQPELEKKKSSRSIKDPNLVSA
jgi:hypothetical protein